MTDSNKKWYAIYTHARTEKVVSKRLIEKNIETYLPLHKVLRQWSDRKKMVEIPLFNSYVFVKINRGEYDNVLKTNGVVKFIAFEGKAVSIPDQQIETLRVLINSDIHLETSNIVFKAGKKVKVAMGQLKGLTGELVQESKKNRFLVRIEEINQNLLVNIPSSYLLYIN